MPPGETGSRDQWEPIAVRLEELKGVLPSLNSLPPVCPENAVVLLSHLAGALEQLRRRGIRDQIQTAGVQEVAESLTRFHDPRKILETLVQYLRRVFDLREILLLRRFPGSEDCAGFRMGRESGAVEHQGPFPWRPEWSDPILLPRRAIENSTAAPGDIPQDPWNPTTYHLVLPLGRSGDPAAVNGQSVSQGPLGLLCLTAPQREAGDEDWRPAEIARRVEAILENLRHREDLQHEADYRRQLLQGMRDGLLALDREGRIVETNGAADRLLGMDPGALVGSSVSCLAGRVPALAACLERSIAGTASPDPIEIQVASERRAVPLNVAVSRLRDEEGRFAGLVVNLTDLSAVRTMEAEIRRLDRLAALGRFSAGVAHEIRNPLAGIEAGVTYLSGRIPPDAPEQEDFRFLRSEIHRLNRIITELLDYARPRSLEIAPSEPDRIIDRVEQLLTPLLARKRIRLIREGPEGMLFLADPERIEQVLLNLVKNAAEASRDGGAIRICWEVSRPVSPGESGGESGAVYRFRVIDQGQGMGTEEHSRALEPFFTTKSAGGTGLGLSVSHAIVEQHGGRLLLESTPGSGTTAVLELPVRLPDGEDYDAIVNTDSR